MKTNMSVTTKTREELLYYNDETDMKEEWLRVCDVQKEIEKLRDNLYNELPSGDMDSFTLIKIIQKHIKSIDNVLGLLEEEKKEGKP